MEHIHDILIEFVISDLSFIIEQYAFKRYKPILQFSNHELDSIFNITSPIKWCYKNATFYCFTGNEIFFTSDLVNFYFIAEEFSQNVVIIVSDHNDVFLICKNKIISISVQFGTKSCLLYNNLPSGIFSAFVDNYININTINGTFKLIGDKWIKTSSEKFTISNSLLYYNNNLLIDINLYHDDVVFNCNNDTIAVSTLNSLILFKIIKDN